MCAIYVLVLSFISAAHATLQVGRSMCAGFSRVGVNLERVLLAFAKQHA